MIEQTNGLLVNQLLLKKQVASGVVIVGVRRILMQILLTLTNIVIARILVPEIFGVFSIISFIVLTFGLVANFGMGPAIVQKKSQITVFELQAILTLLICASLLFIGLVYFFAPIINNLYQGELGETGIFWLRVFSLSVILDHLATISMHLLQRDLNFIKFTIGEILTAILTQIFTIILVVKGWGLGGLVMGIILGKVFAIVIFYWFHPWPVGFNFSFVDIKKFLPFGLNFQANNLVSSLNGAVVPVVVGTISGSKAVGIVSWAGGIRSAGLAPFDVIEKLIFPTVARVQDDARFLKLLIEKMLKFSCLFSFPLLALMGAMAPAFIKIIYTAKWLPGLTTLYLSIIQGMFLLPGILFTDVLLALGKSALVRNISIFWAILQWLFTIPLVVFFGFNGVVVAGIIVSATFFVPLILVKKIVSISFWPNVLPYFLYALAAGIITYVVSSHIVIESLGEMLLAAGLGGCVYLAILLLFEREALKDDWLRLKELVFPAL